MDPTPLPSLLDGSVRWVPQQLMFEHYATIPHGTIRGYW